ncbi:hypothetical protein HYT25_02795 [Candidatus Pacearchaeota archaeon]|nr:hypothetical protein [Candidatus Pacearchaeota archaeon]
MGEIIQLNWYSISGRRYIPASFTPKGEFEVFCDFDDTKLYLARTSEEAIRKAYRNGFGIIRDIFEISLDKEN